MIKPLTEPAPAPAPELQPLNRSVSTAAQSYDSWFRAKVIGSIANPGPGIPHAEVMSRMEDIIVEAEKNEQEKKPLNQ